MDYHQENHYYFMNVRNPDQLIPSSESDDLVLFEKLSGRIILVPEHLLDGDRKELTDLFQQLIQPRDRALLAPRYGLAKEWKRPLDVVDGDYPELTRERLRQIEEKTLRKLKSPAWSKRLKELLNDSGNFEDPNNSEDPDNSEDELYIMIFVSDELKKWMEANGISSMGEALKREEIDSDSIKKELDAIREKIAEAHK